MQITLTRHDSAWSGQTGGQLKHWSDSVRKRRLTLKLTQLQLCKRLGITERHLSRIENGSPCSGGLQMHIDKVLNNWTDKPELHVLIDYVRIRFPTQAVSSIMLDVLHLSTDHLLTEPRAPFGYETTLSLGEIKLYTSSPQQPKLGTLLELRGQGCRQFESLLLGRGETWYDFLATCMEAHGVMKRFDLAVNDMVDMLDIPALIQKIRNNECITVMRQFEGITSGRIYHEDGEDDDDETGTTLYIGSKKSDLYFCLYEKDVEQRKHPRKSRSASGVYNRFEIRLSNDRATKAAEDLLNYRDEERTIFGIIKRYLRFVDARPTDRLKWPVNKTWERFVGQGREPLRLTMAPQPLDLNRTRAWIDKQVAPMQRVLHEIDGYWGNQQTMNAIRNAPLTEKHEKMIAQYTTESDQLQNGLFESEPECEQSKKDDHADQSM
ncbi:replication initiation factor domain-containing protein [Lacticaseibacillus parakribbianus]|uniref:replication initiation factor domain-containing protein n=1 Tax=Lacticaseibacillus parakribbianus TaxID=2970927 RepID=UPI0021CB538E|nr:replication initiation factor domain-containing protein [Lacticaseibacillus parakribbianus]